MNAWTRCNATADERSTATPASAAQPLARSWPTALVAIGATAAAVLIALGGCASSASIESLAKPLTAADVGLPASDLAATSTPVTARWWQAWRDPTLDALIERAEAGQPTLKAAQARLVRASAAVASSEAAGGPQLRGSANATRQHFSANATAPPPLAGSVRTLASAQFAGSWEIDFFGRHRAALDAALGTQRAAEADLDAARTLLASQVARGYVQLGRLQAQREVAVAALHQRTQTLALVRQRVESGLDTNVELRQSEGALPDARLQIETLDEQVMLARHALAALTAQPPEALAGLQVALRALPALPLPALLPADLLSRRADVAAARARAEAAAAGVRGARADFYPNVNLTAFVGVSSIGLDRLFRGSSREAGAGPALHLPIFDGGRLRAQLRGRSADLDAAVEAYNATLLDAVRDAADQIGSTRSLLRQQAEQAQAQAAAETGHDLALQRFRAGLANYLTVLNAESQVLAQRRLGVDLAARLLDTQVALARALGGGWRETRAGT